MPSHPHLSINSLRIQIKLFRLAALLEGTSLLFLVAVAVPVKYILEEPALVKISGPVHGLSFIAYLWTLIQLQKAASWPVKYVFLAFFSSLVPFGSFVFLRTIHRTGFIEKGLQ